MESSFGHYIMQVGVDISTNNIYEQKQDCL